MDAERQVDKVERYAFFCGDRHPTAQTIEALSARLLLVGPAEPSNTLRYHHLRIDLIIAIGSCTPTTSNFYLLVAQFMVRRELLREAAQLICLNWQLQKLVPVEVI